MAAKAVRDTCKELFLEILTKGIFLVDNVV